MDPKSALRGLCTISLWADDVQAATKWSSELLGLEPYFIRPEQGPPQYVEFRLGDYQHELGIIDKKSLYNPHCLEVLAKKKNRAISQRAGAAG